MNTCLMKYSLGGNEYDKIALQYQKVIHAKWKQYYNDLFSNISWDTKRKNTEANKPLFQKEELALLHFQEICHAVRSYSWCLLM